ncbi:MAG TPA: MFS transporter [Candidatus Cloacimonetes bacterium]|nr:MFS transporter [Candidatus Cloacimonadota bacterium]
MGISFLQIGLLFSIREISTAILEIPTGIFADCFGRKNSMIFSFLSYIASFIIFYFFPVFSIYIIAMIFFAFGEAFRTGTHKAMILEYLKIKKIEHLKVEYYGFTRSWSQKGSAISSLIAGAIVFYSGQYKFVFLASIVPYLLELVLMISYPTELNGEIKKVQKHNFLADVFQNSKETSANFLKIFHNPALRKSLLNSALYDSLFKSVKDYIQPVMQFYALSLPIFLFIKDKRDTILIAIIYFVLYLLTSTASKNSGKFMRKFQSLAKAINVSFIIGVFFVILAGLFYLLDLKLISVIFFILLFVSQNLRRPMNVGYISETIPSKVMASGLSAESQLKTLIIAILAPLMGFLSDNFGIGFGLIFLSVLTLFMYPLIRLK